MCEINPQKMKTVKVSDKFDLPFLGALGLPKRLLTNFVSPGEALESSTRSGRHDVDCNLTFILYLQKHDLRWI